MHGGCPPLTPFPSRFPSPHKPIINFSANTHAFQAATVRPSSRHHPMLSYVPQRYVNQHQRALPSYCRSQVLQAAFDGAPAMRHLFILPGLVEPSIGFPDVSLWVHVIHKLKQVNTSIVLGEIRLTSLSGGDICPLDRALTICGGPICIILGHGMFDGCSETTN